MNASPAAFTPAGSWQPGLKCFPGAAVRDSISRPRRIVSGKRRSHYTKLRPGPTKRRITQGHPRFVSMAPRFETPERPFLLANRLPASKKPRFDPKNRRFFELFRRPSWKEFFHKSSPGAFLEKIKERPRSFLRGLVTLFSLECEIRGRRSDILRPTPKEHRHLRLPETTSH